MKILKAIEPAAVTIATLAIACLSYGCGGNEAILMSGKETPRAVNSAPAKPPVEKELDAMRTAGFQFIYVLKRKDGGKLDAEDRGAIKLNTADANRRVATDDELAIVIGTNMQIPPDNMAALYQRFAVDNYSQAVENSNSNANK